MPLLQLLKNTTAYEEIPVNLNGRYRVFITGFDIIDSTPGLPLYSYINSNVLGIADKCVGTTSVPGLAVHSLGFIGSLKEPIDLGICQVNNYIDLTITLSGGLTLTYLILNLDVVAVD